MTVAADKTKEIYTGNDVTTVFPYPFKIFQAIDMLVIRTDISVTPNTETTLTEGVDYSVSGIGDESGGNVTYPLSGDPLTTTEKLTVWRVPAILQGTDFQNQGGFFAQTHEDALDLTTMISQYLSEFVQRAFSLAVSDESGASLILPSPVASTVLGWNSSEDALENINSGSVSLALPASDSIIADMINAAGTQATLTKLLSGNTAIWQKGADVASAAILPVISDGNYVDVTGVAVVTSIATVGKGTVMILQFDGILVFTHHATNLFLCNKGNNITTAAGDHAIMEEYDTGKWRCVSYQRADGSALNSAFVDNLFTISDNVDNTKKIAFQASGITTENTRVLTMPDKDITFDFGTYSPTLANASNFVSATARPAFYTKIGNVVTVSGQIINLTVSGAAFTRFSITLPIPSNLGSFWDVGGSGTNRYLLTSHQPVLVEGEPTSDKAYMSFNAAATSDNQLSYSFSYEILT